MSIPNRGVTATIVFSFFLLSISVQPTEAAVDQRAYARFVNQFLNTHNTARTTVGMRRLVWDLRLARYAERYAASRRFDCALKHSNGPYGENIFWGSGAGWTPAQAVAAWVTERKWYDYWSNSCVAGQQCGHYTQVVWKGSSKVGCARVNCFGGRGVFITCNYDPPGNFIGERPY